MTTVLSRLRFRRGAAATDDAVAATAVALAAQPMPRTRFGAWLGRPMTSFHLIIAVAALLTTLGLTMVLSASGVYSYDSDGSPWVVFGKQVLWTVVGLVGFYIALRMPVAMVRWAPVTRSISQTTARSCSAAMPRSPTLLLEPMPTYRRVPSALAVRDLVQW